MPEQFVGTLQLSTLQLITLQLSTLQLITLLLDTLQLITLQLDTLQLATNTSRHYLYKYSEINEI
jgi:hypothetical protein